MGEERRPFQQEVRFPSRQSLEPFQQTVVNSFCTELIDQVIIVDGHLLRRRTHKTCRGDSGEREGGEEGGRKKTSILVFRNNGEKLNKTERGSTEGTTTGGGTTMDGMRSERAENGGGGRIGDGKGLQSRKNWDPSIGS
jgi:hypothetical protein